MTSDGLGQLFEGDFAVTSSEMFSLMSMRGQATPYSVRRREERTPIGMSGNLI